MSNQPTLSDYARRMRSLVEENLRIAADLRAIAKEMRERGYQAVVLKAVVKAQVAQENGDEKPMEKLKARTQEIAIYADALGDPIEGFGETKRFVVNNSDDDPPHDPETGEITEQEPGGRQPPPEESREASERVRQSSDAEATPATVLPRPVQSETAAPVRIPSSAAPPPEDCPEIPKFLRRTA